MTSMRPSKGKESNPLLADDYDPLDRIHIKTKLSWKKKFERYCFDKDMTMTEVIIKAVDEYMRK
jgi:hypothetical protein